MLCRVPCQEALGKEIIFFEKCFAECPAGRHSAKKLKAFGKEFNFFLKKCFAECPARRHSAKKLIFFWKMLCRVPRRHSAKKLFFFKKNSLPSALRGHSAKLGNLLEQIVTLPSVISPALGKVTRTDLFIYFSYFLVTNKIYHIYFTSQTKYIMHIT